MLALEHVTFVKKLEVELAAIRDGRIIHVKRQLSQNRRGEAERTQKEREQAESSRHRKLYLITRCRSEAL